MNWKISIMIKNDKKVNYNNKSVVIYKVLEKR
jgi:hypothetical protein